MIRKNINICILCLFALFGFNSVWADPPALPAFPGAEGFGRYSIGGRGGTIYEVTNLDDSGPESLRAAVEASGPRIVVFRVSGTIELLSELKIDEPYITIAGQTAPGDGICLKGARFKIEDDHVIIRYMRFRLGRDAGALDSVWIEKGWNIILDHCSASWSGDEALSAATDANELGDVTVQWCMITEGLNYDGHSYGSLVRGGWGNGITYHHNLYAHNKGRNPRPGNYNSYTADPDGLIFDFRNNVIYNWDSSSAGNNDDTTSITRMNFVGNYYKRGLDSDGNYAFKEKCKYSRAYFSGNWMNTGYPSDPWSLVNFYFGEPNVTEYKLSSPVPVEPVTTDDAETAYDQVLADAGASFPERDSVDERIINDVIDGTGSIINDEDEVGGWPVLDSNTPPTDTDHDGMPDDWEFAYCLDPCDSNDSSDDRTGDGYTNIEEYINWLPLGEPMPTRADLNCDDIVDLYDFSEFAEHYSSSSGSPLYDRKYDFNNDDVISIEDLFYIVQDWLWVRQE